MISTAAPTYSRVPCIISYFYLFLTLSAFLSSLLNTFFIWEIGFSVDSFKCLPYGMISFCCYLMDLMDDMLFIFSLEALGISDLAKAQVSSAKFNSDILLFAMFA